jgi:prephenate dehydrogenase
MPLPVENSIKTIALIGAGLIGGSLALAVKRSIPSIALSVYDPSAEARLWLEKAGMRIKAASSLEGALADADLIVVAAPVGAFESIFSAIRDAAGNDALVIDVASTKVSVLDMARRHLGPVATRFVGCHPIAGSERSGAVNGRASLFDGRPVVLCPDGSSSMQAVRSAWAFWQQLGAKPIEMSAPEHDRLFAYLSHVPHLLAFAYMSAARSTGITAKELDLAGSGFRDFTRIAASDPALWSEILLDNRTASVDVLNGYIESLERLRTVLTSERRDLLVETIAEAQAMRLSLQ